MNALQLAVGLFSIIPAPAAEIGPEQARRALLGFPALGLLFGLAVGSVGAGLTLLSGAQPLAAVLIVVGWQLLVGGMHADGLADTFDGIAALGSRKAGRDAHQALEVMRAPDIGAMGVVAIIATLGVQAAALASAPSIRAMLVLAVLGPFVGRLAVLTASRRGVAPARRDGFGALFADTTATGTIAGWLGVAVLISSLGGWWLAGPFGAFAVTSTLLLCLGLAELWRIQLCRRFGGITGDMFGAISEVTCALLLATGALVLGAVA